LGSLGTLSGHLGAILGHLGLSWGSFGTLLEHLVAILALFLGLNTNSGKPFLAPSEAVLGGLRPSQTLKNVWFCRFLQMQVFSAVKVLMGL